MPNSQLAEHDQRVAAERDDRPGGRKSRLAQLLDLLVGRVGRLGEECAVRPAEQVALELAELGVGQGDRRVLLDGVGLGVAQVDQRLAERLV